MKQHVRERIALVIFALLLVFAGIVLTSYFSTGRSWTIAATFVDDTVGGMDGYLAVVYSGTLPQDEEEESGDAQVLGDVGASDVPSTLPDTHTDSQVSAELALHGDDEDANAMDIQKAFLSASSDSEGSVLADTIGLRILSMYPRMIHEQYDGVFVSDVRDLYERKGAQVITLNLEDPNRYAEPTVLFSGNKSIGVFSLSSYMGRIKLEEYLEYFDARGVDAVICIAPRLTMLSSGDGIDVILVTSPIANSSVSPAKLASTSLVLEDPKVGDVGVVLFSLNNVPASRTISAL